MGRHYVLGNEWLVLHLDFEKLLHFFQAEVGFDLQRLFD
jgi:hypothetical protein